MAVQRRAEIGFNGVKVFSATMFAQRDQLGDVVTEWIRHHPERKVVDIIVTQSSDAEFHCISLSVFFWQAPA